jgi:hypothetical protein
VAFVIAVALAAGACDAASPAAPPPPAVATRPTTIDEWLETLDANVPDAALTSRALELLQITRSGGWEVTKSWEGRASRISDRRRRSNGQRVIDRIERWDQRGSTPMPEAEFREALRGARSDGGELSLALLANVPMPGNSAEFAMDALVELRDPRTLDDLRLAREINAVGMPGDATNAKRLAERLDRLIADLERSPASR